MAEDLLVSSHIMEMKNLLLRKIGRAFQNLVFRMRLGRSRWSARVLIGILDYFGKFEIYSNTKNIGRFDHYVPQVLLRAWRIAEYGSDSGQIYRWSKNTGLMGKFSIKSVAGQQDWDVTNHDGELSDYIGKVIFSETLEDKARHVLKRLRLCSQFNPTYLEESVLAAFISHQITRVPAFRKLLSRFFSIGYAKKLIEQEDFGRKKSLIDKVVLNEIGLSYEQLVSEPLHYKIEGGKPAQIFLSLVIASSSAEKIYSGNLHILEVPKDSTEEFIISDNPVVIIDMQRRAILGFAPWWEIGKTDLWIIMPISPRKAVFYTRSKRRDGNIENSNEDLVNLVNQGQVLYSTEEVYSRSQSTLRRLMSSYSSTSSCSD